MYSIETIETIETIQNVANLVVCTATTANIIGYYYWTPACLYWSMPLITLHFICDFAFAKPDIKVHHVFGMMLVLFNWYYQIRIEDNYLFVLAVYKTEISTFFYVFKLLLQQQKNRISSHLETFRNTVSSLNDVLFFATFFKYRLWDYYRDVVGNVDIYRMFWEYTEGRLFGNAFVHTGLWGLFALNIYWFTIVMKMAAKQVAFLKTMAAEKATHFLTAFICFLNTYVASYVYSYCSGSRFAYTFDLLGIMFLSCSNFEWHDRAYQYLKADGFLDYLSINVTPWFLLDKFAIHLRSFLCSVTAIYDTPTFVPGFWITFCFHSVSFLLMWMTPWVVDVRRWRITTKEEDKEKTEQFMTITNALTAMPCLVDTIIIAGSSSDIVARIRLLFVTVLLAAVLKVQPLYRLNHILFHFLLMAQTFCLSSANTRNPCGMRNPQGYQTLLCGVQGFAPKGQKPTCTITAH